MWHLKALFVYHGQADTSLKIDAVSNPMYSYMKANVNVVWSQLITLTMYQNTFYLGRIG